MIEATVKMPDGMILHCTVKGRDQIQYWRRSRTDFADREFGLIGILDKNANTILWAAPENVALLEQLEED